MAQIDLGKLKFQWKGTYSATTAYEKDDVVYYDGSSYVATADIPATNTTDPYSNSDFDLMSQGLIFEGVWQSTESYQNLSVVTHESATWISTQTTTVGEEPDSTSAQWDLLTPAPAANVLTSIGDMLIRDKDNNSVRLPVGAKGATLKVVEDPNHSIEENITYSVGTGTPATAILTDGDDSTNVYGTNTENAAINMSRERTYKITFPADGQTYSIKDPDDSSYNTAGTGGRVTEGVNPEFISNGGTITIEVTDTTPTPLKIRNEASGADEATVTVVDMALVPSFGAGSVTRSTGDNQTIYADRCNYDFRNTMTTSLKALEQNAAFGRGAKGGQNPGYVSHICHQIVTSDGKSMSWGNNNNGTTNGQGKTFGAEAFGNPGSTNYYGYKNPTTSQVVAPEFFKSAVAGVEADAKFLTNLEGSNLGYTNTSVPRITEVYRTRQHQYCLSENGIIFFAGSGAQPGSDGAGGVTAQITALIALRAFDQDGSTELTGTNRPKFKQVVYNSHGVQNLNLTAVGGSVYGLSTDGEVFSMGDNGSGQLGQGDTLDSAYFRRIDPANFNNEAVIFITAFGSVAGSAYAITETGKLFGWGNNARGQLGDGTATNKDTPFEMTGVSGSAINGKVVTHVMGNNAAWNTYAHFYILTTEGKVYALGDREVHGVYLGVYDAVSAAADLNTPTELTDAATTINSGGQQVVSMWMNDARYSTAWFITDGGTSGVPKMYACGNNAQNQQGTNSPTSSGATTAAQGDWFLSECVFRTGSTDASCKVRADVTELKIGDPCIVYWGGGTAGTGASSHAWLLDSNGQLWVTGNFSSYNPVFYTEADNLVDFEGTATHNMGWVIVNTQPEPMKSLASSIQGAGAENWYCIGESGNLYTGGPTTAVHAAHNMQGFQLKSLGSVSANG